MAVSGSLSAVSPADILQLVGRQHRSGVLRVTVKQQVLDMWMDEGMLVRIEARNRPIRDKLGMRLLRAGLINQKTLDNMLALHRTMKRKLGTVLVLKGVLTPDTITSVLKMQALETLDAFMFLNEGTYEFLPDTLPPSDGVADLGLRWEAAMMDSLSRVNEWPALREALPEMGAQIEIVKVLPPPEGGRLDTADSSDADLEAMFMGTSETGSGPAVLGADEQLVFEMIAPGLTAQQVVDRALIGEFAATRALHRLIEAGYIRTSGRGEDVEF